jgi:putative flippase GtrA
MNRVFRNTYRALDLRIVMRFVAVGITATLVYCVVALTLSGSLINMQMGSASALAFILSLLCSYLGHAKFTYRINDGHLRCGFRFAVVAGTLSVALSLFAEILVGPLGVGRVYAVLIVAALYPPISFIIHSSWSFSPPNRGAEGTKRRTV